ncbi:MAG: M1 family peptidase, partial [Bacteroidota bacterium]
MMKRILVVLLIATTGIYTVSAQSSEAWKKQYRAFETKENDLIHTKIDARFDFDHSYLLGKVWLTLKPHFYATDSLWLDAKQMDIHLVEMVKSGKNIPLSYEYDSMRIKIHLDKSYSSNETYT